MPQISIWVECQHALWKAGRHTGPERMGSDAQAGACGPVGVAPSPDVPIFVFERFSDLDFSTFSGQIVFKTIRNGL